MSEELAASVKRHREGRGLTQQQLATRSGVPRPTLAHLESGAANPTLSVLLRVAACLEVPLGELVGARASRASLRRATELPERRTRGAAIRRLHPDAPQNLGFERIELAAGARVSLEPAAMGALDVIACESGELSVDAGGELIELGAGDVVSVAADAPRRLSATGRRAAIGYRLALGPSARG